MSTESEELFDHHVTAWTVGQLREALEGVPDDLPICVIPAEEPGGDVSAEEQVIFGAAPWADADATSADEIRDRLAREELLPDHFEISLEFPSGQYWRRRVQ